MKNLKEASSKIGYVITFICDTIALICTMSVLVLLDDVWWLKFIYLIWHSVLIADLVMEIRNYKEFKRKNGHC